MKATNKQACDHLELTVQAYVKLKVWLFSLSYLFSDLLLYLRCAILREDEDVIITDVLQVSLNTVD